MRRRLKAARVDDLGTRTARYGAARLFPYTPPWALWAALPVLVAVARGLASGSQVAAMLVAVGLTLSVAGLTVLTWHTWRSRGRSMQVHATVFTLTAGLWVLVASIVGLVVTPDVVVDGRHFYRAPQWLLHWPNWWIWGVWAFFGIVGCLSWSIRRAGRGEGNDEHRDDGGLMETIEIAGRAGKPVLEANNTRVRVPVQMDRGRATAKDLQDAKGNIASFVGVRESGVRVERNPDDFSRAEVVIVPRDLLKFATSWPGPNAPGASVVEEIHVARAEDGEVGRLWLPGDPKLPRNATHLGIAGMTGAGKTEGALVVCAELITRKDVSLIWSDHVKGLQSVAPIAGGTGLLLLDKPAAVTAFRRLPTVIAHRTAALGKAGFSQWTPDAFKKIRMKYLVYWLEEGAALIANSETFVQLTEQARSAGITIVVSQQRFSHDRMPTSARSNLGAGWCFGVKDDTDAGFVLSEQTLDAGAAPWEWKNNKPGYCYMEAPGVPEDRWPIPHRVMMADDREMLREVVREWADPALDHITANAFGKLYADYRVQVLEGKAEWQTTEPTVIPMPGLPPAADAEVSPNGSSDEDADVDDDEDRDVRNDPDMPPIPENPEPGFMDDVDPTQEIPEDDDEPIRWGPPPGTPKPTRAAAVRLLDEELARLAAEADEDADEVIITTSQLAEFRVNVLRRSAGWLSGELARLVEEERLDPDPDRGAYRMPLPVPA